MKTYSKYGGVIRLLRKEKGWSQEKLAEEANLDPKTVIQIEGGKRNPTLKTLQKLASALRVSINQLLEKP